MNAIVVVDQNWGIGREGNLLVHLPGDLKYYKKRQSETISSWAVRHWNPFREASLFQDGKTSC